MKFDIIIGNPPYQTKRKEEFKKSQPIWPGFVELSCELTKKNGYTCLIHPSGWRNAGGMFEKTKELLLSGDMIYLEIHDVNDGLKTFGACTRYDWYVRKNAAYSITTETKDQHGITSIINLSEYEIIPSSNFDDVKRFFAVDGEDRVEVVHSGSAYMTCRKYMSREKTDEFCYPCSYFTRKNGTFSLFYSNTNQNGHFGIPKVIFSNGRCGIPIVDATGEYGATQFSYFIVDEVKNLGLIQKAMDSDRFIKIMADCSVGGCNKYNKRAISLLRKDFWKEFLEEQQ